MLADDTPPPVCTTVPPPPPTGLQSLEPGTEAQIASTWYGPDLEYSRVASALGRALHPDDPEFWEVVVELTREYPQFQWHNAMTDSGSKAKPD